MLVRTYVHTYVCKYIRTYVHIYTTYLGYCRPFLLHGCLLLSLRYGCFLHGLHSTSVTGAHIINVALELVLEECHFTQVFFLVQCLEGNIQLLSANAHTDKHTHTHVHTHTDTHTHTHTRTHTHVHLQISIRTEAILKTCTKS